MKKYFVVLLELNKRCDFYENRKNLVNKIFRVEGNFYFPVDKSKYGMSFYKPKVKLLLNYQDICCHNYPDGSSAMESGFLMRTCKICGWDDLS